MKAKKIVRISENGETNTFNSLSEAERLTTGATRTLIGRAARKGMNHAGYTWAYKEESPKLPDEKSPKLPDDAITEDQLREMYNIRSIVFKELDALPMGGFYRDSSFVRKFQGKTGFRGVLESPEAQRYRGKGSGGVVFWGHPDSVQKMKNEGTLI